jgi:hypothetical protein
VIAFDTDMHAPASGVATIIINAPVETVWRRLAGIQDWPLWNAAVSRVEVSGPILFGTEFRWKAGGLPIRSRIEISDPTRSIGWIGDAPLIHARHVYHLSRIGDSTRLITRESFAGPFARLFPNWCAGMITSSLEQGLSALKIASEADHASAASTARPAA